MEQGINIFALAIRLVMNADKIKVIFTCPTISEILSIF